MHLSKVRSVYIALLTVLVVLLLSLVVAPTFSRLFAGSQSSQTLATGESAEALEFMEVTVGRGDTVWKLARTYGPESMDIRKIVYIIEEENQLQSYVLHPGDKLFIPVSPAAAEGN